MAPARQFLALWLAIYPAWAGAAVEPEDTRGKRTPLPSEQNVTVEFENTGINAGRMDPKLFGAHADPRWGPQDRGDRGTLWWEWRSPESGWYAIDRPDEPSGASDEYPWPWVFLIGPEGTLSLETDAAAWNWLRAVWFWAPKGTRHAICVVSYAGKGAWRLLRLATTPLPEEEQVVMVEPGNGAVVSWRVQPARIGVDKERNAIVDDTPPWKPQDGGDPPKEMPPGSHIKMRWTWKADRAAILEVEDPPDEMILISSKGPLIKTWRLLTGWLVRVRKGDIVDFSARIRRTQLSEVVHLREFTGGPSNTSSEAAEELKGHAGEVEAIHPGSLGPPEDPIGAHRVEKFPLWWRFRAPTAGVLSITDVATDRIDIQDLRGTAMTLQGDVSVCHPGPDKIVSVLRGNGWPDYDEREGSWPLRRGDTIWIRGCGTEIGFKWAWTER